VQVAKPATVASALRAGHLAPRSGRLLSLVTRKVLNPALTRPQVLVNGAAGTLESPVAAGANVGIVEPPDVTEDAVEGGDVIPAPPEPEVIHGMWHPGQPGKSVNRKGAVSGEVIATRDVQAPVPPVAVTEKLVALTFDDGPWPTTPEILRVLREKNVKATFCVVTRQLKKEGLEYAKGALGEGHKICNHTVDHDQALPSKPQKVVDDEIRGANRQLVERLGFRPFYYRPPGGSLGPNVEATAKDEGQQVLLWTIDTKDYTRPPVPAIVGAVMGNLKPGAIILMHDGGGDRNNTVAALPIVIDQIRAAGYDFIQPEVVPPVPAAPVDAAALPA
jgi:peptidoglycan/xylan/chitin deacetylase (PgdA/CDA1 family)